jgi:peptidoglycan/xylan/chitin deacetylase (PgdA/CDA1 family)
MFLLVAIVVLLISPFYCIYKPPHFLMRYFQYHWPYVLWHVSTSSKTIALTIDDAPSQHTEEIMEILKANNATATFFIIGSQIPGREQILQDLIRNGNELGNHAMHDEPSRSLPDLVLADQIQTVAVSLQEAYSAVNVTGPPKYFRPGSGFFSERMQRMVNVLGYRIILGSIYPHDPGVPFWLVNAWHILSMLHPGGIIICHDRRSWTPPMLRKVLPEMRRRGYRVVTLTELLKEETT